MKLGYQAACKDFANLILSIGREDPPNMLDPSLVKGCHDNIFTVFQHVEIIPSKPPQ
jgi:hypothetical protein